MDYVLTPGATRPDLRARRRHSPPGGATPLRKPLPRRRPLCRCLALLALLLLGALVLASCGPAPVTTAPPPGPGVFNVPPAVLEAILAYFATQKALNFGRRLRDPRYFGDRHRGFFVWRRAKHLGGLNSAWANAPNQPALRARIDSEYQAVEAYLQTRLGTLAAPGPYGGAADPVNPAHLDLADVARTHVRDRADSGSVLGRLRRYRAYRRQAVEAIVWRSAALHDELWQPAGGGATATLREPQMNEILDRRLRIVERMQCNVAVAVALGGAAWPSHLPAADSGWTDGFRVRMFEYPRVPKRPLFRNAIGAAHIETNPNTSWAAGKTWREARRRFEYNVAEPDRNGMRRWGLHFHASQQNHWLANSDLAYRQTLSPSGRTAAEVIDDMFTPNPPNKWEDWWGRTWLWCDHAIAALHLEALLFGKRRRDGNANAFNALIAPGHPNYVQLTAPLNVTVLERTAAGDMQVRYNYDRDILLADDTDPYFQNSPVDVNDLQVGDHLLFWNSLIYTMITRGDWRLENALVMTIDSDPRGGVRLARTDRDPLPTLQIGLQGHGTWRKIYGDYTHEIASTLTGAMGDVRSSVRSGVPNAPAPIPDSLSYSGGGGAELIHWEPYAAFARPGSWWIRIPPARYNAWGFGNVRDTVRAIRKSVAHVDDGGVSKIVINSGTDVVLVPAGAGYNPPQALWQSSVFFPIFEPAVAGRWNGYLQRRSANPAFSAPSRLRPLIVDGSIMPGIYYSGVRLPIPVVRPKVN